MNNRNLNEPAKTIALTGANQLLVTGDCVFLGLSIMDESAGSIKVQVYDGTDDTGKHLCQLSINSGGEKIEWFGPGGIKCDVGLYFKVYSGTPTGVALYK